VTEYGVGYIKIDYNIEAGPGTEVASDSFGDGLLEHNRAYLAWVESIMDKYPELVIENCSSGGMRMDYAMLSVFCLQSVTDQEDFRNMAAISAAASTAALPEQAAMWAYPMAADKENEVVFNMVNAMMLRMHLSGQIHMLSDRQLQLVKRAVECYKSIRADIAQATVFYPFGLPEYNDEWICAGYDCGDHAYMSIWRLDTDTACVEIPVSQYNAEVLYALDKSCDVCVANGKLKVRLDDKYSAALLKLK
ncbi:MAG: alpha-galactosidase, partial [Clostridia bacterium]|nr:alpha-galactosidase [Clostridia bacterium]